MASLSIVKTDFGKILKWVGVVLGILVALFLIFKIIIFIKNIIAPPPPPTPTTAFGKLPKTNFPDSIKKDFTYEVDTLTGDLPGFPNLTKVYKMEERGPDILAVDKASNLARALGFNPKPEQLSDFIYRWRNPDPPDQILVQDIRLNEFNISSLFLKYEDKLKTEKFRSESEPVENAVSFLQKVGQYPDDIDTEKTKVEFSMVNNSVIQPSTRLITSNLATIYFFQKPKEDVPIVYPQGKNSSMKIVMGSGSFKGSPLEASFSNQKILDESGTYPIKSADQALEDLKSGNAFIQSHSGDSTNIKIKKVYLALFYEGKLQKYLTPVIVFEGDNNFMAYVPAVTDGWFDK